MADIVLKNAAGEDVSYEGVTSVVLNTSDGSTATFSEGETAQKSVSLSMASGNQVITPDEGELLTEVTVVKPSTLKPANIVSGVTIGGVTGTHTDPTETSVSVALSMASGNQVITPGDGELLSQVTVQKPSTLIPENILSGITIGGVTGTASAESSSDEDSSSDNANLFSWADKTLVYDETLMCEFESIIFSGTCSPAGSRVYVSYVAPGKAVTIDTILRGTTWLADHANNKDDDDYITPIYADSDSEDGSWTVDVPAEGLEDGGTFVLYSFGSADDPAELSMTAKGNTIMLYLYEAMTRTFVPLDPNNYEDEGFNSPEEMMIDAVCVAMELAAEIGECPVIYLWGDWVFDLESEYGNGSWLQEDIQMGMAPTFIIANRPDIDNLLNAMSGNNVAGESENLFEYSRLTIKGDLELTDYCSIIVTGDQQSSAPETGALTGSYGVLEVDGTLTLSSDTATLYARGKVEGSGSIDCWGTIYQPFVIHDWVSVEDAAVRMAAGVFPFSLYTFNHIEVPCVYKERVGKLYGQMYVSDDDFGELTSEVPIINVDDDGLFYYASIGLEIKDGRTVLTAPDNEAIYSNCLNVTLTIWGAEYSTAQLIYPIGYDVDIVCGEDWDIAFRGVSAKLLPGCTIYGGAEVDGGLILFAWSEFDYSSKFNAIGWNPGTPAQIVGDDGTTLTGYQLRVASNDPELSNVGGVSDMYGNEDWSNFVTTTTLTEYVTGKGATEITFYYLSDE
ncbi:MAG: hypothetical protein LUD69_07285 [Oscillospiraceae bacterium]|nr:hypothetical protein [Oscillospiraceae bacterium]